MTCEVVISSPFQQTPPYSVQEEVYPSDISKEHHDREQCYNYQQDYKQRDFQQQYKSTWRLGSGSYGSVYLSKHLATDKLYAVKVSNFHHAMFRKEGEMMQIMRGNANIVRFKECFETASDVRIVMEYCPIDLIDLWNSKFKWQRAGPLDANWENFAQIVLKQMVLAIHDCHVQGMVHCDIKPDNFLLGWDGLLKLTDFAFAQQVPKDERLRVRIGTLYYMAPEVLQQDYSFKADIYSLGVSLLYMLIGKRLANTRGNDSETYSRSLWTTEINWSEEPLCFLPAQSVELLQAMLSKEEDKRPTTTALLYSPWLKDIESNKPIPIPDLPQAKQPIGIELANHFKSMQYSDQFQSCPQRPTPPPSSPFTVAIKGQRTSSVSSESETSSSERTLSQVSPIDPPTPIISEFLGGFDPCQKEAVDFCSQKSHYCGFVSTLQTFIGILLDVSRFRVLKDNRIIS